MTLNLHNPNEFLRVVDAEKGTVDRRIFSDEGIYQLELERIFARAWNFMCHESQIPNPGDFFLNYIGDDRVIAVRDKEGGINVLLNTCRHRGNAVCRADEGHATSFMCTYHGWTYDLKGNLVGVPGYKEFYKEDLNREEWGLIRAAQVQNCSGFVFATLDPTAPPLAEYLGPVGRIGLDLLAARGDMGVVDGVQKYTIGCNWKFAADNVWDWYHGSVTHASAKPSGWSRGPRAGPSRLNTQYLNHHLIMLGEYGHAVSGPVVTEEDRIREGRLDGLDDAWRESSEAKEALGPVGLKSRGHPHIFPNM